MTIASTLAPKTVYTTVASSSLGPLAVSLSELIIGTIAFLIVFAVLYLSLIHISEPTRRS